MIRFYNCKILSLENDYEISHNCELWTKNHKIEYMGNKPENLDRSIFSREIDCQGNLLMPSFKNAHAHSPMTFLRSYADDLPLDRWLNEQVFPMEALLNEDDGVWLSTLAIMEYVTSGITSAFDMYFLPYSIAKAAMKTGFTSVICGAVNNFASSIKELEENYIDLNNYGENVAHQLGFHAEYTTGLELMKEIAVLSGKYKAPVSAHCSETRKEVDECIVRYGKTPVELFKDIGLLEYGGTLFHCNYLTDRDISIIKDNNIYVVTNPASNCKLSSGVAPVSKLVDSGVKVAIGTDGPASNNALDMFREMYLTTVLQKLTTGDASALPAETVLTMACKNGGELMGLDTCLKVGNMADIIMLDLNRPSMQPLNNIVKNIVYSGGKDIVLMTMSRGKILYENGEFNIGAEPRLVYKKCQQITERIKNDNLRNSKKQ